MGDTGTIGVNPELLQDEIVKLRNLSEKIRKAAIDNGISLNGNHETIFALSQGRAADVIVLQWQKELREITGNLCFVVDRTAAYLEDVMNNLTAHF